MRPADRKMLTAIILLWLIVGLGYSCGARAEVIAFEISGVVVEGNQRMSELRMIPTSSMSEPYFSVAGALVQYHGNVGVEQEPMSGSCTNSENTTYLCTLEGSYIKIRVYIRPETKTLFVVESTLGRQGPFKIQRKP